MNRRLLLVGVVLACACVDHDPRAVELAVRDCQSCHLDDEAYRSSPTHATRSTTCADCHRLRDWVGLYEGTHPDAQFTISRGPHKGVLCADCHNPEINPDSSFKTPSTPPALQPDNVICTDCHAHTLAAMAKKHDEVDDYGPTLCRTCHVYGINTDD